MTIETRPVSIVYFQVHSLFEVSPRAHCLRSWRTHRLKGFGEVKIDLRQLYISSRRDCIHFLSAGTVGEVRCRLSLPQRHLVSMLWFNN